MEASFAGVRRNSHYGCAGAVPAFTSCIHPVVRASSTSSGSAPPSRISSWKARMSYFDPSSFSARERTSRIFSPELISERLAGYCDVAVGLGLDVWLVLIGVLPEIRDHLVAGPVLVVDAGIKHQ